MENKIGELHFLTLNPGLKKKKKKRRRRRRGIIGGEEGERTLHCAHTRAWISNMCEKHSYF